MVLIADNQAITAAGIETFLRLLQHSEWKQVSTKHELIEQLMAHPRSKVVLDYTTFDFLSIDELLNVHNRFEGVHWLLFSDELSVSFLHRIIDNEENFGILLKDASQPEISEALSKLIKGEKHITPRIKQLLEQTRLTHHDEEAEELTQSEIEILRMIALGYSNKEIAAERHSSVHTIATHRKNIFRKLDINTAPEATKYAFRAGLIDLAEYVI